MLEVALAILAALLLTALVSLLFTWHALKTTRAQNADHLQTLSERDAAIEAYLDQLDDEKQAHAQHREQAAAQLAGLDKQLAVAQQTQADFEQRLKENRQQFDRALEQSKATAADAFKALAGQTLEATTKQFLQLAEQHLTTQTKTSDAQLQQRKTEIAALVKPMNDELSKVRAVIDHVEKGRKQDQGGLIEQLEALRKSNHDLHHQTSTLSGALTRNISAQGEWGEIALERLIEMAGMTPYSHFVTQTSVRYENARLKPDVVVRLPAKRNVVIDSKTTGTNYHAALIETDPIQQRSRLDQHAKDMRNRVKELASKEYEKAVDDAFEFVVMFVPVEAYLASAAQIDPMLMEDAFRAKIVIASPTTLLPLLKAIAIGWREEKLADDAKHIAQLGVTLHQRLAKMCEHLGKMGSKLDQAVAHYNDFIGSLERQVMPQARRFKKFGAASDKPLPAPEKMKANEQVRRPQIVDENP